MSTRFRILTIATLACCCFVGAQHAKSQQVRPSVQVQPAQPQTATGAWVYHNGNWMYRNTADNRWYYNDGRRWYYNANNKWNVYRFDGKFGTNFSRTGYKLPAANATVNLPTITVPQRYVAGKPQTTVGQWTYHDGNWMFQNKADNNWYYTNGQRWYHRNNDAWDVYRFNSRFGTNFPRTGYKLPAPGTRVEVPRFGVPRIRRNR